jgi:toxoflavin biosynthesis protein ToxD
MLMTTTNRPLRVFLCHSSHDKPVVRELYQKLRAEPWIQPWLDEEELYPGEDWDLVIQKAVEESDVVLVCLSNNSITKRGYIQKELRYVVDIALEIPEEEIFVIPLRLEECTPPRSLRDWQYSDYFEEKRERAYQRLMVSLKRRADSLELKLDKLTPQEEKPVEEKKPVIESSKPAQIVTPSNKITLSNSMEFMRVPAGKFLMGSDDDKKHEKTLHTVDIPYDYWLARFPVTNELYNTYTKAKSIKHPVDGWEKNADNPVVNIKWDDAMTYCQWLNNLLNADFPSDLVLRLPTEAEWEKAARGTNGRAYPWGNVFVKNKCNTSEDSKGSTTSIGVYSPHGDSPYGCADMAGNVWEWTHSLKKAYPYNINDGREEEKVFNRRVLRGGCFILPREFARCAYRYVSVITLTYGYFGFRVCLAPPLPK